MDITQSELHITYEIKLMKVHFEKKRSKDSVGKRNYKYADSLFKSFKYFAIKKTKTMVFRVQKL